ncbi:hypothetical protein D3C84_1041160 [compost metagenome]
MRTLWPELEQAYTLYAEVAEAVSDMGLDDGIERIIDRLRIAEVLEDRAVDQFRLLSARYPDPTRTIVTRWSAHTAR